MLEEHESELPLGDVGERVAAIGDVNDDGFEDLATSGWYAGQGVTYVVFGGDAP